MIPSRWSAPFRDDKPLVMIERVKEQLLVANESKFGFQVRIKAMIEAAIHMAALESNPVTLSSTTSGHISTSMQKPPLLGPALRAFEYINAQNEIQVLRDSLEEQMYREIALSWVGVLGFRQTWDIPNLAKLATGSSRDVVNLFPAQYLKTMKARDLKSALPIFSLRIAELEENWEAVWSLANRILNASPGRRSIRYSRAIAARHLKKDQTELLNDLQFYIDHCHDEMRHQPAVSMLAKFGN